MLVTPMAHLETLHGAMCATAAAPGQQLGATSFPTFRVLTPTAPSIVPRVINAPPMMYATVPQPEPGMQLPASTSGAQATAAQQPSGVNLGIAPIGELGSAVGNGSLAQRAAQERQGAQRTPVRSITNQDVERLNQQTNHGTQGLPPA